MRLRRPSPEHEQAVARRLALLSAELAAVRTEPRDAVEPGPWPWEGHTRIRGVTPLAGDAPAAREQPWTTGDLLDPGTPPQLPVSVPGRHAARRGQLVSWLPAGLRGRVGLQPAHLALVATAVAVALGWTTWWVVTAEPESTAVPARQVDTTPVAAPSAAVGQPPPPGSGPAASQDTAGGALQSTEVVVDVAGRVRRPGLVVLAAGSRVADALEGAGGARRGVDLTGLNLARLLVDGEQLLVGLRPPAGPAVPGLASGVPIPGQSPGQSPGLVNLNTADPALLDTLPGVGPVTAGAIITWRTENGGFSSVEQLLDVNGIGEVTLAELAPLVTV